MSGPVRGAIEGSSFWMNRTRGGCGVTLGAGDFVLREGSCQCPGWYKVKILLKEEAMGYPSPFWPSRWGRSVPARDLQEGEILSGWEVSRAYRWILLAV